ncbi:MAG: hypothetical protein KAS18_04090 [Calditrichia bacterium]|nr:hypothetical protein [Calditrichia bacterium]
MPYLVFIILFFFINSIYPQFVINPQKNDFQIYFNKHNISWNWQEKFTYLFSENNYGIIVHDSYRSNLITPKKNIKNWRDENNFDGYFYKNISNFQPGIYTKSWIFSDQQSSQTNQFSNHSIGIKSNYKPISNINITPYTGYQRAQNKSNIDWGWDLGFNGEYNNFKLDKYQGNINTHFDYDFYPNRQNSIQGFQVDFKTKFSPIATDSIKAYYNHSNKQYYSPSSDRLLNVKFDEKYLHNFFEYRLSPVTNLALQTILSSKNIFDNSRSNPDRDVLRFENRLNVYYFFNDFEINFGFDTFQETQDNTGITTDSDALQTNIRTNVFYKFSPKDQLNFKFTLAKFQFDTPDSVNNNDDRDELRMVGGLEYIRQFSPVLYFGIEAYINFFHQVYIFKERSANNNWNRIFRLGSFVEYKGRNFNNILRNEILANYTVYDFEDQFTQSQSFIFRKYILENSLSFSILPRLKTGFNARYEFEDKGSFFKSEFAQQILQTTETIFFDYFIRFKNIYLLDFDGGIAFYARNDWRHVPKKSLIRDIKTTTPYLRIRYGLNKNLQFISSASYVFTDEMNMENSSYTTGSLSLIHKF